MKRIELDFADNSRKTFAKEVANGLMNESAVMLRNAIPKSKIEFYKECIETTTKELSKRVLDHGISLEECNKKFSIEEQNLDKKKLMKDIGFRVGQGMISIQMLKRIYPQFSYHDLISDIPFFKICSEIYNGEFEWFMKSQARRVSASATHGSTWSEPIHYHFDAQYHRPTKPIICFWTALTPCGEKAPSLQVLLCPHNEVQKVVEFNKSTKTMNESIIKEINLNVSSHFDSRNIWKPIFDSGDICLFSTWTLHASHTTKRMTKKRLSSEIRVVGKEEIFF